MCMFELYIQSLCSATVYCVYGIYPFYRKLMNDTTIRLASDTKCVDISNYGTTDGSNIWYTRPKITNLGVVGESTSGTSYSEGHNSIVIGVGGDYLFSLSSFSLPLYTGYSHATPVTRLRVTRIRSGQLTPMVPSLA